MLIPSVIGGVYLLSAALFYRHHATAQMVLCIALSPAALLLTLYLRRLAAAVLATAYLKQQEEAGLSKEEALAALENGAAADIDLSKQDVAQWPFTAMLGVAVGAFFMLGYALLF